MQCHGDQCVRTMLLLHNYVSIISCKEYKKTGLWVVSDDKGCKWLGVSPNGIVDGEIVVEIKCPYMGGNPYPYRKVPITYIPQCQLEMYVTNTTKCHFVCWTPKEHMCTLLKEMNSLFKIFFNISKHFGLMQLKADHQH